MPSKKILITIDVEDWFQVENLRQWFPPEKWDHQILRVEHNTHRILDLLDSVNTAKNSTNSKNPKATFFILGWIAEKCPDLVREIHSRGHEVASHGYGHLMCNKLSQKDLKADLVRSKHLLEDIIGNKIIGYRAPNFSVNDQAIRAIQETGYIYDSSYNNFSKHNRYGQISLSTFNKRGIAYCSSEGFFELPISNLTIAKQILPWGGGGYFRLIPFLIYKAGIQNILKRDDAYMFYLHPWEIDPDQPKVKESKGINGWRHYLNLKKAYPRLTQLMTSFDNCDFITCSQYLELSEQ